MEVLLVVLVGLLVWILVSVNRLRIRIDLLEYAVVQIRSKSVSVPTPAKSSGVSQITQSSSDKFAQNEPQKQVATTTQLTAVDFRQNNEQMIDRFLAWLAHDWPMKVGGGLLIIAVGWFVSLAFVNDWISPTGRVALGLVFGLALLVGGFVRTRAVRVQGNVLMIVGAITVLVAILSGALLYEIFPEGLALVVMLGVVALIMIEAARQKSTALGFAMLAIGAIVPLFVIDSVSINSIFLYLFVLVAGTLWVVRVLPERLLSLVALLVVFGYALGYNAISPFDETFANLLFALAFIALFYAANLTTIIAARAASRVDIIVAGGVGALFWLFMWLVLPEPMVSISLIMGALVFAIGAFAVWNLARSGNAMVIYSAVAFVMLAVATALELDSHALVVALAVEIGVLLGAMLYLSAHQNKNLIGSTGAVLFGLPVFLSLEIVGDMFRRIDRGVWQEPVRALNGFEMSSGKYVPASLGDLVPDLFVVLIICFIAGALGLLAMRNIGLVGDLVTKKSYLTNVRIFWAIAGAFAMIFVWAIAHIVIEVDAVATMTALIIYTVVGVKFYIGGVKNDYKPYRIVAGLLFAVVLSRLFMVEFWALGTAMKVITFFVIGILFISTSFLAKSKKLE